MGHNFFLCYFRGVGQKFFFALLTLLSSVLKRRGHVALWAFVAPIVALAVAPMAVTTAEAQVGENKESFSRFSIDIPANWTVHKEDPVTTFTHPRNTCALSIMVVPHQDVPFRELGIAFYQNLQGKNPKGDDDGMTFDLVTQNDMPSTVRLTQVGELFVAVTAIGKCLPHKRIVHSITVLGEDGKPHPYAVRAYPYLQSEKAPSATDKTKD